MKNILVLMACLLVCGTSIAQKTGKISGKVSNEKNENISAAKIKLIANADTLMVKNTQTSLDGTFMFENVKVGDYKLSVSMIGYQSLTTAKITVLDENL